MALTNLFLMGIYIFLLLQTMLENIVLYIILYVCKCNFSI